MKQLLHAAFFAFLALDLGCLARIVQKMQLPQGSSGFKSTVGTNVLWAEYQSWTPRAILFHGFLSADEREHLIALGRPHMEKSTVVDNDTGKSKLDSVRTSSGMFLTRGQDSVVSTIEHRIALHSLIPMEHGEGLQILHYEESEKYSSHYDYFHDSLNQQNGGQRIATMLMYLSNVDEGGETVFPDSATKPNVHDPEFSACAQAGVAVKPKAGDALLFYSLHPDGTSLDPSSLHGGCPVLQGSKWSATKWMRVKKYLV